MKMKSSKQFKAKPIHRSSRTTILAFAAMAMSLAFTSTNASAAVSLNGGTSWEGWESKGLSNQLGVYGKGSTTNVYEVYTTIFSFNNDSMSGGAVGGGPTGGATGFGTGTNSSGAFANGNRIFGVGVRRVGGLAIGGIRTIKFDLDGDSFAAASSVGGSDGKTSFSTYSEYKDFTVQFQSAVAGPADAYGVWNAFSINTQAGQG